VAEEIVFGRISTGAQNDLERITKMAYAMVVDYGMSEKVGYISFNLSSESDQPRFNKPYSESTGQLIDQEVKALIDEVHEQTRRLLDEKRDLLESLAQALLKKEVLNEQDLTDLLGERPYQRAHYDAPTDAEQEPVNVPPRGNEAPPEQPPPVESGGDGALSEEDTLSQERKLS
jgi:cell division protease FtsH